MMVFQDMFAGFVPVWNTMMYYTLQALNPEFWIQDDPHDE